MSNLSHKRNYALDISRVVAVLAVVMIHCSAGFVVSYSISSHEFIMGNLFDSISRIGVPLFLMISGALFLDEQKEVTLKNILSKNVKNIVIILFVWTTLYSIAYNIMIPLISNNDINIKNIIYDIVYGHYHMWYLYMILGIYIITPFLRKFVTRENKILVLFFIIISFCCQFTVPVINAICKLGLDLSPINKMIDKFNLDFFNGYITYYLIGWYVVHIGIKQKWIKHSIYSLGIMSLAFIFIFVCFTGDYNNAYENISVSVLIYSVSVFIAINSINWKFKERTEKKLIKLSNLTFGVYIIHVMIITVYSVLLPYRKYSVIYIIGYFIAVVFSSFFISYIISKIPVLKKIIKA